MTPSIATSAITLISSLKKGNELTNVEAWKKGGVAISVVTAVVSLIMSLLVSFGMIDSVNEETIMQFSSSLVMVVGFVLSYIQLATTKKIGIGKSDTDVQESE